MTTPPIEELRACARGCTYPNHDDAGLTTDEPSPDPRPATHGLLCGRCYYRLTTALDTIPELVHNMRSQITKTGAAQYGERVTGGGDGSPAPLAIDPLDASDSLYAKLVSWSEVFAHEFGIPQPRMSVWANFREVQGFRPVTPDTARNIMQQMTRWYLAIAEQIAASAQAVEFHDDLCYGWDDARGVFPLLGRYGIEPRPPRPPAAHECPVCGADDIFVKWPDKLNPDLEVLCARCHHLVDADLVNRHARNIDSATPPDQRWIDELKPVPHRCSGSADCTAPVHVHGCYADTDGTHCDHPELEHFPERANERHAIAAEWQARARAASGASA